jgi:hypothetical protein
MRSAVLLKRAMTAAGFTVDLFVLDQFSQRAELAQASGLLTTSM